MDINMDINKKERKLNFGRLYLPFNNTNWYCVLHHFHCWLFAFTTRYSLSGSGIRGVSNTAKRVGSASKRFAKMKIPQYAFCWLSLLFWVTCQHTPSERWVPFTGVCDWHLNMGLATLLSLCWCSKQQHCPHGKMPRLSLRDKACAIGQVKYHFIWSCCSVMQSGSII